MTIFGRNTMIILPREAWPEDLQHPEVKGIAIGGCGPKGTRLGSLHAHAHTKGESRGWICFRSGVTFQEKTTRLHELAHVVTREGHTKRWREFLLQIGGTLEATAGCRDYYPKKRTRARVTFTDVRADGSVVIAYSNGAVTCYPPGSPGALRRGGKSPVTG